MIVGCEPCDRMEEARDVRLSSRSRKRVDWGAWGILTMAKARSLQDKAYSRV
jgi:hypothetical protein